MLFDIFEILFKSNAKQTRKEISDVGDETDKTQKKINDTDKATQQLSNTLLKVGLQGLAAFTTFEGIKAGIQDAVNFNAALEKTHQLTGANADQLAAWDATFSQFGSSSGEFLSWFSSMSQIVQKTNGDVNNIIPNLRKLNAEIYALPEKDAHQLFQIRAEQNNLPQDFYLALRQSPQDFEKVLEKMQDMQNVTKETTREGLELESAWKALGKETQSAFTAVMPVASGFLNILQAIVKTIRSIADIITIPFHPMASLKDLAKIGKESSSQFKEEQAQKKKEADEFFEALGLKKKTSPASVAVPDASNNKEQSRAFWLSQGYTPAQVSGLLATEQAESGFDPGAVGDSGQARGSFQHHADRRAAILAGTGIDVASAGHADQLRAAAWELEKRGDAARLRATQTPEEAAGVLTKYFERPADITGQSYSRGIIAGKELMNFADQSPINSLPSGANSSNVTIGNVIVNTQATDANGIATDIKKSLDEHLSYLAANANDGIAK